MLTIILKRGVETQSLKTTGPENTKCYLVRAKPVGQKPTKYAHRNRLNDFSMSTRHLYLFVTLSCKSFDVITKQGDILKGIDNSHSL